MEGFEGVNNFAIYSIAESNNRVRKGEILHKHMEMLAEYSGPN